MRKTKKDLQIIVMVKCWWRHFFPTEKSLILKLLIKSTCRYYSAIINHDGIAVCLKIISAFNKLQLRYVSHVSIEKLNLELLDETTSGWDNLSLLLFNNWEQNFYSPKFNVNISWLCRITKKYRMSVETINPDTVSKNNAGQ